MVVPWPFGGPQRKCFAWRSSECLLSGRHSEIIFQVRDEPRDDRLCDALARAEHQLALKRVERKCIHHQRAASAAGSHGTSQLGALAERLTQYDFGKPG